MHYDIIKLSQSEMTHRIFKKKNPPNKQKKSQVMRAEKNIHFEMYF